MQIDKRKFSEVLDRAKKLGFAENNPISDLNGNDSAAKLRILSSIAFNKTISKNKILTEGIQNINLTDILHAKRLGYKIKLLSISEIKNNSYNLTSEGILNIDTLKYIHIKKFLEL